jgi:hypothetical protein
MNIKGKEFSVLGKGVCGEMDFICGFVLILYILLIERK